MAKKNMNDQPEPGKFWNDDNPLDDNTKNLEPQPEEQVQEQDVEPEPGVEPESPEQAYETEEEVAQSQNEPQTHFDPATQTQVSLPSKDFEEVYVNPDELKTQQDYLSQLKAAQLQSEAMKWYQKYRGLEQWAQEAIRRVNEANKKGLAGVNVPAPSQIGGGGDDGMKEMMDALKPMMAMKMLASEGEGGNPNSFTDMWETFDKMQEKATKGSTEPTVTVTDPDLGSIELPASQALAYKNMLNSKQQEAGDSIIEIEYPDGSKKRIPEKLYLYEMEREDRAGKKRRKSGDDDDDEDGGLNATVLEAFDSIQENQRLIAKELKNQRESNDKSPIARMLEDINSLKTLYKELDDVFGDRKQENTNESEDAILKRKMVNAITDSSDDDEEKQPDQAEELDAITQKSRQEYDRLKEQLKQPSKEEESEIDPDEIEIPIT